MILELKRDKERKGAASKTLAEELLGKGVEVRALTAEATLKVKNLDEVVLKTEIRTSKKACFEGLCLSATANPRGDA